MPKSRVKDKGGRPTKFTPTAVLAIVAAISEGQSRDDAARAAGVGPSTLYRWIQRGRAGEVGFVPLARAIRGAQNGSTVTRSFARLYAAGKVRL